MLPWLSFPLIVILQSPKLISMKKEVTLDRCRDTDVWPGLKGGAEIPTEPSYQASSKMVSVLFVVVIHNAKGLMTLPCPT